MKKNLISTYKYLLIGYGFGGFAVLLGLVILIFGEVGRGIGDTVYQFRGFERLYCLYPIFIGLLFIFGGREKHTEYKNKKD
ncbi:MAG: hypothetical protein WBM99_07525 [Psychromonas sp.]